MKSQKIMVIAVISAAFLGVAVGVTYTQGNSSAVPQDPPRPTVRLKVPAGEANTSVQQKSKPELEVQSGDSETIKALKTELKELRQRIERLEYEMKPRMRPIAQR